MKKLVTLLLALLLALGLVACGDSKTPGDEDVEILDPNTEGKITVAILANDSEIKMFTRAIEGFNSIYKNIEVELMTIPDYESSIMGKLNGGEEIDVIHTPDNMVSYFAEQEVLTDLTPYMEQSGFDESKYYKSMMDLGKSTVDGKQYMMPRDYSKMVTFYNKEIFDTAGVDYPKMGWTWEDFLKTCEALKSKIDSKYYVVDASMEYAILNYSIMASNGADKYLDDTFSLVKDTSKMKAGMEMAKELVSKGYAPNPDGYKAGSFFKKTAAMTFDVRPNFSSFATPDMENDFDVVNFPLIGGEENGKIATGTSGFSIYTGSSKKNMAWAFINYIMSEDGQKVLTQSGNAVPVLKSLAESDDAAWRTFKNGKGNDINNDAFTAYADNDVVSNYFGNLPPAAVLMYKGEWSSCCMAALNGTKTVDKAFADLNRAIETIKRNYPEYF